MIPYPKFGGVTFMLHIYLETNIYDVTFYILSVFYILVCKSLTVLK